MPTSFLPLLISSLTLLSEPDMPTEVIGSAATPDGGREEITVEQPENAPNPFGYVAPESEPQVQSLQNTYTVPQLEAQQNTEPTHSVPVDTPQLLVSQSSTTNPQEMSMNPLDYQNKIENTIYQDGDRLLDVQSIPIKDISSALTPNIQPTISDYPAW